MRTPSVRGILSAPCRRLIAIGIRTTRSKIGGELIGLIPRQRGAHEPDDRRTASLMDGECVEEAFHHDDGRHADCERAVQTEKHALCVCGEAARDQVGMTRIHIAQRETERPIGFACRLRWRLTPPGRCDSSPIRTTPEGEALASRTVRPSIRPTRSRPLPPMRPPRACTQDCERHDQTLRATFTAKTVFAEAPRRRGPAGTVRVLPGAPMFQNRSRIGGLGVRPRPSPTFEVRQFPSGRPRGTVFA